MSAKQPVFVAHSGFDYRLRNRTSPLEYGSVGAVLSDPQEPNARFLLTCSHVALGGRGKNMGGRLNGSINVDVMQGRRRFIRGQLVFAERTKQTDIAIIKIRQNLRLFDNELPKGGGALKGAIDTGKVKEGDSVQFYSSLDKKVKSGNVISLSSSESFDVCYSDGIQIMSDLILIGQSAKANSGPISKKGDSGSVLYTDNNEPFAMVIGGNPNCTLAVPISDFLNKQNKFIL